MRKFYQSLAVLATSVLLISCTTTKAIEHRNLTVGTKMSDSIFLTPVSQSKRTVFVQVKNTSDKSDFTIKPTLLSSLQAQGYTVVSDVDQAHYLLQANVLKIEKMTPEQASAALSGGFGALAGGAAANVISGGDAGTTLAGAAIVGAASAIAGAMVKNIDIVAVVDIQVSVRTESAIKQSSHSKIKQGSSTTENQSESGDTHWKQYRTRVVSTANKINLTYQEAKAPLEQALATSISGVL